MRFSSLCVALATVCAAHAISLPVSLRQTVTEDAIGVFNVSQFFGGEGQQCPFRISHSQTINDDSLIPHTAMTIGPFNCTDEGSMSVFLEAEEALAASDSISQSSRTLIELFDSSDLVVLYGVETTARECGFRSLSPGTVVLIFTPAENIVVGLDLFFANRRYMFVDDPAVPGICRYSAFLRPADPEVEPEESPDGTDEAAMPTPMVTMLPSPIPEEPTASPDATGGQVPPGVGASPTDIGIPPPEVTETEDPTASPEDDPICFPADGSVQLQDGSVKRMDQLQLGDSVLVGPKQFSEVFLFSHRLADVENSFVRLELQNGRSIEATVGHYVYANGRLVAAAHVKVGDVMELDSGEGAAVARVSTVRKKGLFNPQTMHGDIVVNGVRASTFTQSVQVCTATALMAPLRLAFALFGWSASFLDHGLRSVANALPAGAAAL